MHINRRFIAIRTSSNASLCAACVHELRWLAEQFMEAPSMVEGEYWLGIWHTTQAAAIGWASR